MTLATTLAELLDDLETKPRRYPVVRSGERDPIPWVVQLSVCLRDGFRCRECGWLYERAEIELDHMLPWSAGGGDESSNLRVLCIGHNQRRSNWDDGAHLWNLRPTTWWCWECWRDPAMDDPEDAELEPPAGAKSIWRDGTDLNTVPRVQDPTIQAYCASCQSYGWTDAAFTAADQGRLVALTTDRAKQAAETNEEAPT